MDGEDEASEGDVVAEREEGDGEVMGWFRVLWFRWMAWCEVVKLLVGFLVSGFGVMCWKREREEMRWVEREWAWRRQGTQGSVLGRGFLGGGSRARGFWVGEAGKEGTRRGERK